MVIQWFPGHMSKARRQVQENLKYVDFVIELVDARLPISSRNPMLGQIIGDKPRIIALNKERGIAHTTLRTMIIGIPNAGKSTLMNRLAGKKVAVTGNRPGVTKGQQWIRTNKELELLDTPGILWPKFEDQLVGLKLALTGAIKDDLLPMDEVTIFGLNYFLKNYRTVTMKRYRMTEEDLELEIPDLIMELTARFGFRDDYDRFYNMFVKDVRDGKLGLFCLDEVGVDGL